MVFGLEDLASGAAASITVDCSADILSLAWSGSSNRIFSGLSNGTLATFTISSVSDSYRPPDLSERRRLESALCHRFQSARKRS